ncbi:MAG: hypothetical protein WAL50_11810 [Kineosporiaceae bacterium]
MLAIDGFTWGGGLNDMWSRIATTVPKLLYFLAILVIGWFVVRIVRRVAGRLLERVGFDAVVDRAGLTGALSSARQKPSGTVAQLLYYALMLLVLTAAFAAFGSDNPISRLLDRLVAYLPRVFVAIAIVVVAGIIARKVVEIVNGLLDGKVTGAAVMARAAGVAVMAIGGFAALSQLAIAPAIINGLFYAALAVIVGSAVIAIGGGGIGPMHRQWEKAIGRLESDPGHGAPAHDPRTHDSVTVDSVTLDSAARESLVGGVPAQDPGRDVPRRSAY